MRDDQPDEVIAYLDVFVKFGRKFVNFMISENDKNSFTFLNFMASFTKLTIEISRNYNIFGLIFNKD